ncbi:hypothetical protein R6Q59_013543 [Mikania micrantha]
MPQSSALSPSFQKTEFMDPSAKFTSNIVPSAVQIMLGSLNPQGSSKLLSFSNTRTSIKRAIMGVKIRIKNRERNKLRSRCSSYQSALERDV